MDDILLLTLEGQLKPITLELEDKIVSSAI